MLLKGINLTVMIGPGVPIAVSSDVLNALTSVEVTANTDGPSVFQLKFTIKKNSPILMLFLLASGAQIPLVRVVIYVTINGSPQVLMDGVMTDHQVAPGNAGQNSTLTITGEDLTRVMDYIDFTGIPYPAMPPEARVFLILVKYAIFGVIPMVIPSIMLDVPIPIDRIPLQQGTDLAYVKKLADDVGYTFFVKPGPAPGSSIAYWGPDIKVGAPQPALNMDMDAATNVESHELLLQRRRGNATHRLHPGAVHKSAHSDSDSRHHASQPATWRNPALPETVPNRARNRQALADPSPADWDGESC